MLKISIITPSFNQGKFIEQTINSVLAQEYPNLEYIVVDGGSTDNTVALLKKYGKKLKWISEKDKGQSDAINKGLKMAKGDIVAWINSDDFYMPGAFKRVVQYFENNPEAMWLSGDYRVIDEHGRDIHEFVVWYKRQLRRFSSLSMLSFANYIIQPSTFWRKEVLKEAGLLNESYRYCMDYDLWLRIMKKHPLHVLSAPLSAFRIHGQSKGGSQYKKQFEEEIRVVRSYQSAPFLLFAHKVHNGIINLVYDRIK